MGFFQQVGMWWAQIEEPAGAVADPAKDAQNGPSMFTYLLPIMAVMIVFMLMARPKKGDAKLKEKLAAMKKNDRVVTAGGILGTVINLREDTEYVTLRIDEASNAKMQVLRSSIIRVIDEQAKDAEKAK